MILHLSLSNLEENKEDIQGENQRINIYNQFH
jgi:hypothetical protein